MRPLVRVRLESKACAVSHVARLAAAAALPTFVVISKLSTGSLPRLASLMIVSAPASQAERSAWTSDSVATSRLTWLLKLDSTRYSVKKLA